eukprot:scaffold273446_cov38-Prasinocladus_malaysianus.AAC.1
MLATTTTTSVTMEFFHCFERSGRWYLAAEPSIECYDLSDWNTHTRLLPLCCAAIVVYVIGIPALFATLLYRKRKSPLLLKIKCSAPPAGSPGDDPRSGGPGHQGQAAGSNHQ